MNMKKLKLIVCIILLSISKLFSQTGWKNYNTSNSGILNDNVNSILVDDNNNKWIGTQDGIYMYNGSNWIVYNTSNSGLPSNDIRFIKQDAEKKLWFATNQGICKYDGKNWITYNTSNSGISSNNIYDLIFDKNDNLWIGTDKGLNKYDKKNWVVYNTSNSGITSNFVGGIAIDQNDVIWICRPSNVGLTKFDGANWTTYNKQNSNIPTTFITSLATDKNGVLWLCTYQEGLIKYDGLNWTIFKTSNSGILSNNINCVSIDKFGNKWIGTNALSMYNDTTWTNYSFSNSRIQLSSVETIFIDHNGNKLLSSIRRDEGFTELVGDGKSFLCSNTNKFSVSFARKCTNSTAKISLKHTDNNYLYKWSWTENNINYTDIKDNIIVSKDNLYRLDVSDQYCFKKDSIGALMIFDTVGLPPSKKSNIIKYNALCSNSSAVVYNPYPRSCKIQWIDKSGVSILSNNQDSIKLFKNDLIYINVFDSLCQKTSRLYEIKLSIRDTFLTQIPICMVTNQNNHNLVIWENINNTYVNKYKIYKQSKLNSNYILVHEQSKKVNSTWLDTNSNNQIERYKLSILDACGRETMLSENHTTILLSSNLGSNSTVNLAWNPYEGFSYKNFEIWRSTDGVSFNLLSTVANNTYAFIDNNPPATGYYQIRIVNPTACNPSVRGIHSVISNTVDKNGKIINVVGLEDNLTNSNTFRIFPNPNLGVFIIENVQPNTIFSLFDLTGHKVYEQISTNTSLEVTLGQEVKKGIYFLQVTLQGNLVGSEKIVIE